MARNEATAGSDLDWTLLVDGQCDTRHLDVTKAIKALVEKDNKPPGPTALFGTMAFSHELVHLIGGEADSNRNTVPRFLLNDIVRFWRTMTVDYATKRRDRDGKGWALRNFKLRLSRKLTFTAGLAMCMSCQLCPPEALVDAKFDEPADFYAELENYLVGFSNKPPLQVVAELVLHFRAHDAGKAIFDAYDQCLTLLGDPTRRDRLEKLGAEDAGSDPVFTEARAVGTAFQDGLTKLFFETDAALTEATQRYGVF